ncbi:methylated-DNA--[protein]-cysteine S-methyltransferase [Kaistia sp. 32K]|uniref:methylated-DNA--[protein]-cysteine S-methyltransferase n=1 Tax=Kaistia sp. 32K TaxID=2795690 RepID=UPI001915D43F|nr:methylated-DNA--[protein]-cysteine S-methyltransferase [Kaistia sp. 32K]BCP54748.1 methylated-DNA--[protein]-cysteine S-methyltransferase [Kaistia sp. 32K]
MSTEGLVLFETPIGPCGISWSARGITGLQFPGESAEATRSELARRFPKARDIEPPAFVTEAIAAIVALLEGADDDLTSIPLDPDHIPPFNQRVYDVTRAIPPGETLTYGEVAAAIGEPGAARAVGRALGENPYPIIIPCHRVLAAGGKVGGFSGTGGIATKRRILAIESRAKLDELPLFGGGAD